MKLKKRQLGVPDLKRGVYQLDEHTIVNRERYIQYHSPDLPLNDLPQDGQPTESARK